MFGMLIHVCRDETKFSAWHQHAKALLKNRADALKEPSVNRLVAQVLVSFSVISLVPIWRACDNQPDGSRHKKLHVTTVAEDYLRVFSPFRK